MTEQKYPTPAQLFGDALDMPIDEREAYLRAKCGDNIALLSEVRTLIKAYEQAEDKDFLDPSLGVQHAREVLATWDVDGLIGIDIGSYRVIDVLGEGGMGVVFRAQQARPKRTVALKVIRPGVMRDRLQRRFELEAELLGRLQHPGIAQVYEAGTAQTPAGEQPFFAMELVEGKPLLEAVQSKQLDLEGRVALMVKISDAVQHAHLRGVIHRDLKPSNILVDNDGDPKILDFGIARLVEQDSSATLAHTQTGQVLGTLQYMSPEQCAGDPELVDGRTDVYALGAILYHLITGRSPRELEGMGLAESIQTVQETTPTPPSRIVPGLPSDINTIVMKAIELDPARRYQSAAALSDDLQRFLKQEPITARPPSLLYHTHLFVRRRRTLVTSTAIILVILIISSIVALVLLDELGMQQDRASEVQENFMSMIESTRKSADISLQSTQQADAISRLLEAASQLDQVAPDHPNLVITNRNEIGLNLKDWEAYTDAQRQFEMALELSLEEHGPDHRLTALSQHNLASALWFLKDYKGAQDLYNKALRTRELDPDIDPGDLADTIDYLGSTYQKLNDYDQARAMADRSLKMKIELYGRESEQVANVTNNIGWQLMAQKRYEEAEPFFREALRIIHDLSPQRTWLEAISLHNLAYTLMALKEFEEAELLFAQALELKIAQRGPNSLTAAITHRRFAELLLDINELKRAKRHCEDSIKIYQAQSASSQALQDTLELLDRINHQLQEAESAAAATSPDQTSEP